MFKHHDTSDGGVVSSGCSQYSATVCCLGDAISTCSKMYVNILSLTAFVTSQLVRSANGRNLSIHLRSSCLHRDSQVHLSTHCRINPLIPSYSGTPVASLSTSTFSVLLLIAVNGAGS